MSHRHPARARPRAPQLVFALATLGPVAAAQESTSPAAAAWELVESAPVETELDHPDLRDAYVVWPEMIGAARERIDLAMFYAVDNPESRLGPTMEALRAAVERGVRVRFLYDATFRGQDAATLSALGEMGVELRGIDVGETLGGVLHAKYFVVDGEHVFAGSQNFDWRSLEHIGELGLRVRDARVAAPILRVFEMDWALAGGAKSRAEALAGLESASGDFPVALGADERAIRLTPALSPTGWLPDEGLWDQPALVALIDAAETSVRLQVMTYKMVDYERRYDGTLESALRRAAARGVAVELLVADWSKRRWTIEGLQSLQVLPGVDVRLVTLPQAQAGFVPFARVVHAKYLVVDGARGWLGSSNWEPGYFHASRNVGFLFEGAPLGGRLLAYFAGLWESEYAYPVDPCAQYEAPRIGR